MANRPPVSGSMAGHCRREIWLAAHGAIKGDVDIDTQITFDLGHLIEQATFGGFPNMPPWWDRLTTLVDPVSGFVLEPQDYLISHRQLEVEFGGFSGHLDALFTHRSNGSYLLPDLKTAGRYSFEKNMKEDLLQNVFSREYVCQLHHYHSGCVAKLKIDPRMCLIFFNKDAKKGEPRYGVRSVEHSLEIIEEIKERLTWANSDEAPERDYEWTSPKLPLRCQYCQLQEACAQKGA